jgi:peroxiredoxin
MKETMFFLVSIDFPLKQSESCAAPQIDPFLALFDLLRAKVIEQFDPKGDTMNINGRLCSFARSRVWFSVESF